VKIWSKVKGRDILRTLCRSVSAGSARFVRYERCSYASQRPIFIPPQIIRLKRVDTTVYRMPRKYFLNEILLSLIHLVEDLQSVIDQFFSLGEKLHFRKRKIQTVGCRPDYLK
jgi:hypothetical protein